MRLGSLIAFSVGMALAEVVVPSIQEVNAGRIGDLKERPEGHRTTPYADNLKDPYTKFAEEADAAAVLGE